MQPGFLRFHQTFIFTSDASVIDLSIFFLHLLERIVTWALSISPVLFFFFGLSFTRHLSVSSANDVCAIAGEGEGTREPERHVLRVRRHDVRGADGGDQGGEGTVGEGIR